MAEKRVWTLVTFSTKKDLLEWLNSIDGDISIKHVMGYDFSTDPEVRGYEVLCTRWVKDGESC